MRTKLIEALRMVAGKIAHSRSNRTYDWSDMAKCNCGLLACEISGVEPDRLDIREMNHIWSAQTKVCLDTGIPLPTILANLVAAGLSLQQIEDLEYLADKSVRQRAGLHERFDFGMRFDFCMRFIDYKDRKSVASYMRALADAIEEEDRKSIAVAQVQEKELIEA